MAQISGRLIVDLHPDGTVRMLFVTETRVGENETPMTVKNLNAAEIDLVTTWGLTLEQAASLRTQLERNSFASIDALVDEVVAAKFRHAP
jgi:hypothetical protein